MESISRWPSLGLQTTQATMPFHSQALLSLKTVSATDMDGSWDQAVERIACVTLVTNGPKTTCSRAFLLNPNLEYTVGHFAYTYILDEDKKPRVRYVDDSWLASDFVEDVVELAEREGIISNESEGIPSVGLLVSVAVVSMAAISLRSKSE